MSFQDDRFWPEFKELFILVNTPHGLDSIRWLEEEMNHQDAAASNDQST